MNSSDKPILDMHMYEVKYVDDKKSDFSANLIAENMLAQIDKEWNRHMLMDEITNHRFDEGGSEESGLIRDQFLCNQMQKSDNARSQSMYKMARRKHNMGGLKGH